MKANKHHRDRPYLWFLLVCMTVLAWPIVDASTSPARPVHGKVTGFQPGESGGVLNVIAFPDGSVVRKPSAHVLPEGTAVPCVRYTRRLSGAHYYEC